MNFKSTGTKETFALENNNRRGQWISLLGQTSSLQKKREEKMVYYWGLTVLSLS
jgi:hypothetical protein